MKRKYVIAAVVVLGLMFAGYMVFLRSSDKQYDFRFDKVSTGDLTVYVTATGTINPVTSVDVGTQVSGIVAKLFADFNSVVKQGQVIAQIDSTFLVQSVRDAEANLDKAKAQLADSKRNFDREKALFERGLESQLNYDAALTAYESNAAAMKSARASLDRAKINLAYATIYAPISGVVINRAVNVGQTVAASFSSPTLYTIANDLSKMQVLTTVDESDIGRVSIGQQATFTVDAYPDEAFHGSISQIRLAPVTVQNVVNYTVVIDVNNDQLKLMPGMTANVKVMVADMRGVLKVPNMALRFQPPGDVIDTSNVSARRGVFAATSAAGADSSSHPRRASSDPPNHGNQDGNTGGNRRRPFQVLRDSITAAHGGNLSEEDLRAEMRKASSGMGTTRPQATSPAIQRVAPQNKAARFGIDVRFPEYEKSAYVPQHESGRGRVWIVNAKGKLEPVFVKTGVTDGKFTEITASSLKSGDQVVLGVNYAAGAAAEQTRNPLAGGGQQQRPGGGFR